MGFERDFGIDAQMNGAAVAHQQGKLAASGAQEGAYRNGLAQFQVFEGFAFVQADLRLAKKGQHRSSRLRFRKGDFRFGMGGLRSQKDQAKGSQKAFHYRYP